MALCAGIQHARSATPNETGTTATNVGGSVALTPNSIEAIRRVSPSAAARPKTHSVIFLLLTEGSGCTVLSVTEDIMSKPSDLVQGTLDMLPLKILALEPMNGFAVSQRLKQVSGDVLQVSDGSLYPVLHKLEQEGWITAEWKNLPKGRRAKYYALTRLGRRQLEKEAVNWSRLSNAISRVAELKEA
jgi:PadR family transcriptional regulator, regulatory protein PadR